MAKHPFWRGVFAGEVFVKKKCEKVHGDLCCLSRAGNLKIHAGETKNISTKIVRNVYVCVIIWIVLHAR